MTPLEIGGLTLFIVTLLFGVWSTLFGLPGTIIILVDAVLYASVTGFNRIGLKVLIILLILTILAEMVDFVVGMSVSPKLGMARRTLIAVIIGGAAGSLLLTPILLGLGLIVGAFMGGLIGILVTELLYRSQVKPVLREAWGMILVRSAGICAKGLFSLIMVVITLTQVYS